MARSPEDFDGLELTPELCAAVEQMAAARAAALRVAVEPFARLVLASLARHQRQDDDADVALLGDGVVVTWAEFRRLAAAFEQSAPLPAFDRAAWEQREAQDRQRFSGPQIQVTS